MKKIILLCFALIITSCSNKKDANEENFTKAINTHFSKKCVQVGSFVVNTYFDFIVDKKTKKLKLSIPLSMHKTWIKQYDYLAKKGYVEIQEKRLKGRNHYTGKTQEIIRRNFIITQKGKAAQDKINHQVSFCVGNYQVTKIISFTKPANQGGTIVSFVTFDEKLINIPKNAQDEEFQKIFDYSSHKINKNQKLRLKLTNNGWIVE